MMNVWLWIRASFSLSDPDDSHPLHDQRIMLPCVPGLDDHVVLYHGDAEWDYQVAHVTHSMPDPSLPNSDPRRSEPFVTVVLRGMRAAER